jgi:hypothetical protein
MSNYESNVEELFIEKFEKLALKVEQLTDEISKMKNKLDKNYKKFRSIRFCERCYGDWKPNKKLSPIYKSYH